MLYCSTIHFSYGSEPDLHPQFSGPNDEVRVRGGAEGVSDDQERHVFVFGAGVDAVRFRLDDVAIGQDDVLAVESLLVVQRSAVEWS